MKYQNQITLDEMNEYGFFFRSMRESIGYTTEDMADLLDVETTTLRRWENGESVPKRDIREIEDEVRRIVKYHKYQMRKAS